MMGYAIPVTCARCGGELVPVAGGRPVAGTECSAVAGCASCGVEWQLVVHLRRLPPKPESVERALRRRAVLA